MCKGVRPTRRPPPRVRFGPRTNRPPNLWPCYKRGLQPLVYAFLSDRQLRVCTHLGLVGLGLAHGLPVVGGVNVVGLLFGGDGPGGKGGPRARISERVGWEGAARTWLTLSARSAGRRPAYYRLRPTPLRYGKLLDHPKHQSRRCRGLPAAAGPSLPHPCTCPG